MNPERLLQNFDRLIDTPDAVPRLRRFILDLAVRGKLVEQNPEDEPAAELLKRIEGEKKRLIKKRAIKELKSLLPIEDAVLPFAVPKGWKWTRLGDSVNNHFGGGTPSKSKASYWDGDIFWASVKDIGKTKYVDKTIDLITKSGLENSSSNLIPPGNLIVVTRMGLGKVSINRVPIAINQDLRALILSGLASIDFYYIFFKTASYKGSGLTVKGIKVDELLNFPFPLPPLSEQNRIVAKVDELMKLCDELEATQAKRERRRDRLVAATLHGLNNGEATNGNGESFSFEDSAGFYLNHLPRLTTWTEHIQQLRQTILNLAVRGKLVRQAPKEIVQINCVAKREIKKTSSELKEDPWPHVLPASWRWQRLEALAIQVTDGEHATPHRIMEQQVPLVTAKNVRNGQMDYTNTDWVAYETATKAWQRCRPQVGDILLVCVGATTGRLCVLREPKDMVLVRSVAMIRPNDSVDVDFMAVVLRSPMCQTQIWEKVKVTAQPCLYINRIKSLAVPVPPLAEQIRIVAKVDELMKMCDEMEARIITNTMSSRKLLEATLQEAL